MKSKIIIPVLLAAMLIIPDCSCKKSTDLPALGIIRVSKLACRKEPSVKSDVIKYYHFGTPLKLVKKSSTGDSVDGINEYWYQDHSTGGWIFGGYMLLTGFDESRIFRFDPERIRCNVICGGMSCFNEFQPYLVGNRYIATYYMNDYPEKGQPEFGIICGEYEMSDNAIGFKKVDLLAGYDGDGNFIKDIMTQKFETKEYLLNNFSSRYTRYKDSEGVYYMASESPQIKSRKQFRDRCGDSSNRDEIWIDSYELKPVTFSELQGIFPLIEIKGKKLIIK